MKAICLTTILILGIVGNFTDTITNIRDFNLLILGLVALCLSISSLVSIQDLKKDIGI